MLSCPKCRSLSIRRSLRRNFVEKLWSLGGRFPYRCYDCQTRFFAYRIPQEEASNSNEEKGEKTIQVDEEDD